VGVEREEHANAVTREGAKLIELLREAEGGCGVPYERALQVLDIDRRFLRPRVAIKVASDEVPVVGPSVVTVCGAVGTAEAFTLPDKIEEVGFLLVRKGQFPTGEEVDGVEVAEVGGIKSETSSV
jgi:hypothetical protein